jgi:superfamily I DNA/RNA helicase
VKSELEINRKLLEFIRGSTNDTDKIKESINQFFESSNLDTKINSGNTLFRKLTNIKVESQEKQITLEPIPVKTIHDIKGQTLTANMVYLHKDSKEEYGFLTSYGAIVQKPGYYSEIDKRVTYVAMSRATTLLVVALHDDSYSSLSDEIQRVLQEDFEVVKSSSI